jgi:hypothetical protein
MSDILATIEKIIEEHKIILADFDTLEKVVNDAGAMVAMEKSKDAFMPGRPWRREDLQKLEETRNMVMVGLEAHFNREETALLGAFREYGRQDFITSLLNLLADHRVIRSELVEVKQDVSELLGEKLSRALWESKGYDIRARISKLHKTVAKHAGEEQILLHQVQQDVKKHEK